MSDSSRTLEQRIEDAQAAFNGGMRKSLEAAGLSDLLAERDALLERAERAEAILAGLGAKLERQHEAHMAQIEAIRHRLEEGS